MGCSLTKLWHLTRLWIEVLTHVQLLKALPTLKFGKTKNGQNSVRFTTIFEFQRIFEINENSDIT